MKMFRYSLVAAAMLLAACNPAADREDAARQLGRPPAQDAAPAYSPMPGEVSIGLPYHLRSDRIFKTRKGAMRRRVVLEILDGDMARAVETVEERMLASDYVANARVSGKKGSFMLPFKKKGSPMIEVTFWPKVGKKPAHPDARFVIELEWKIAGAPPAA